MNAEARQAISDPGGVRPIAARWTIEADLFLESATHLGGGHGGAADMVILRDARTGGPVLPGTSMAGALRSHLADLLVGYRHEEDSRVAHLFGGTRGDDAGQQSPLIVFDSLGVLPEDHGVEIRDGVRINAARGTAEDHKKFDVEVLPAGTQFPLRFDLLVPQVDNECQLVSLLVSGLGGLSSGDICLGARRSRGMGIARAGAWWAVRHDLATRAGWMSWLLSDHAGPVARGAPSASDPRQACQEALPELDIRCCGDQRRRMIADIELSLTGGLLVRSAPVAPDAPDAVHLQSGGQSVLPGTSLAGVLRSQAVRIAGVARDRHGDGPRWVERLFGPRMVGTRREVSQTLYASRLRISEGVIQDGACTRTTRVRIDRFTHGVVPGALLDEEIEQAGRIRVRMELREPEPGEPGLLILLLKDLLTGDVAVGGSTAVGRGVFEGTARLRMVDGSQTLLDPGRPAGPSVDQAIQELWTAPAIGGAE